MHLIFGNCGFLKRLITILPAQKKIVWETSLGQSLGKSLGVLEKSLAYGPIPYSLFY